MILTYLRTAEMTVNLKALTIQIEDSVDQLTSYDALVLFRRLVVSHSRHDNPDIQNHTTSCFTILSQVLTALEHYQPLEFQKAKMAIVHALNAFSPYLNHSSLESMKLLDSCCLVC